MGQERAKIVEVITTPKFWDCECKENYIHTKADEYCFRCGALQSEQPDSRVNEVAALIDPEYENAPEVPSEIIYTLNREDVRTVTEIMDIDPEGLTEDQYRAAEKAVESYFGEHWAAVIEGALEHDGS